MKYLTDYTNEKHTALLEKTGAFWAFGDKQFNEQKKEGIEYVNCGAGMVCPKGNVEMLREGLQNVVLEGIAEDILENGMDAIIERELANHEAWYTGNIEHTEAYLFSYGFDRSDIIRVYKEKAEKHTDN